MFKKTNVFTDPSDVDPEDPKPAVSNNASSIFQLNEFVGHQQSERRGFSFDFEKARNFDQHNVRKAREGVKEIFADAMEQIKVRSREARDAAHKEGFEQGQREGYQAGEQAAREEFTPFLQTLQTTLRELSEFRKTMYPKVEREMIDLIVDLAKKVIQRELETREDSVRDIIRLAVESVLDRESMVIRVNPADKAHAEQYSGELKQMFQEIRNLSIEEGPSIPRGGCKVETNFGTIEAGLDNIQEQIEKILHLAPPPPQDSSSPPPAD